MSHHPLLIPLHFSFILKTILFLSLLFFPTTYCASDGEGYINCAPFTCGNFSNISYPFWGNNQPDYCGHPKFKLDCHQQDQVTIDIMSQKFLVIDINQHSQSLKIARTDLWTDPCPKEYTNVMLDSEFFSYSSNDDNITLFYDCDPLSYAPPEILSSAFTFRCIINGAPVACLMLFTKFANSFNPGCKSRIIVPVLTEAFQSSISIKDVLDKGFEVEWNGVNGDQCDSCIQSGGRCGYNSSTNEFICFCKNQQPYGGICDNTPAWLELPTLAPSPTPSQALSSSPNLPKYQEQYPDHTSRGINWQVKLGIGVGAAVFGVLAASLAFVYCQRQKKASDGISYVQPRSMSSDPSSLKDTEAGSINYGVHLFTYNELEEATNFFDPSRELGEGGFGTVYYGKLRDGRCVAVKRLYENNYKRVEQFKNEIEILTGLHHKNLVSLYGCTSRHSRELLLVYEYIPNGTVADHLHGERAKAGKLPWHIRMNIAVETASALAYLHASEVIHRDVKTNNILLDSHFVVKVADFGLSRLFPTHVTHVSTAPQGTPGYVDPEYHECYQLTVKSDVYSFGVVLVELISSLPAVDITRHRHEINLSNMAINKIHNQALHELVDPNLGFDSDYKVRKMINAVAELAFQCLQSSKDMRPSMEEVLDTLRDIQSDGKYKSQPEVMDISTADDVVLLKDDPPPPSPDSNVVSKSTTPNASG